jgi:DNA-binding transcriptional LysR family regulator
MLIRTRITTPVVFDPASAERRFVITSSDYAFNVIVAETIRKAAVLGPNISFDLVPTTLRSTEHLERGEIDLFITISPHMVEGHPHTPLWKDEHCVIAWRDGRYGQSLTAKDFLEAGHSVTYFGSDRQPAFTEAYFTQLGVNRRIDIRSPNFNLLPETILGTDRIATMYRRHAEYFARFLPLSLHVPPIALPDVVEEVQWHKIRDMDDGLQWLIALLKETASELSSAIPIA